MKRIIITTLSLVISFFLQAQVSKTVNITPGGLLTSLSSTELSAITDLTVKGTIDARDFKTMRDKMPNLYSLDISAVNVASYNGTEGTEGSVNNLYPANKVPIHAFAYKKNIASISIPSSVVSIDFSAFYGCIDLKAISIPISVTSIGHYAFFSCKSLTSLTIPSSVTFIGESAFAGTSIYLNVDENNLDYSSIDGVLFNKLITTIIHCPISKSGSYTIPSTVTVIDKDAFYNCASLNSVILPLLLKKIGMFAFLNCAGLITMSLPSTLTSIEPSAFSNCTGLTTLVIPNSVTYIGEGAFNSCNKLTSIILPSLITSIGTGTFSGCSSLTSIIIPPSVSIIQNHAFSGCNNLSSITLSPSVSLIDDGSFYSCTSLTSVTIPPSVKFIGNNAFKSCTNLTSINIPSSVSYIGENAFSGCINIKSIRANSTYPINLNSSAGVFSGVDKSLCVLYIPFRSKSLYDETEQWKDFLNKVEAVQGIFIEPNKTSIGMLEGSTANIKLISNIEWKVSSNQEWLKVSPSSGSGNYTLSLTAGDNQNKKERIAKITVSAEGFDSLTIVITQKDLFATISTIDVSCYGNNNGSIIFQNVIGGSGSYEFSIDGGINWQADRTFNGLSAGIYTTRIRDANAVENSSINGVVEIRQPELIEASIRVKNESKNGANDGILSILNTKGGSGFYEYSIDGRYWTSTIEFKDLAPKTYDILIRDKNEPICITKIQKVIQKAGSLAADILSTNSEFYNNGSISIINCYGGSGAYEYSIDGGNSWQSSPSFNNLSGGKYDVIIRDANFLENKISLGETVILTIPRLELSTLVTKESFLGAKNATIVVGKTNGGYGNYEYSLNGIKYGETYIFDNLSSGVYDIGVYDSNGNGLLSRITVLANNQPVANAGNEQSVYEGSIVRLDGSLSVDSDKDLLTFLWTSPVGINLSSNISVNPTFTAPEIKNDTILTFSLVVNDGFVNSPPSTVKVTVRNVIKTGVKSLLDNAVRIFPNPTNFFIKIEGLPLNQINSISIYALDGKLIKTKTCNSISEIVDMSDLASGTYLVKINNQSKKIIKK